MSSPTLNVAAVAPAPATAAGANGASVGTSPGRAGAQSADTAGPFAALVEEAIAATELAETGEAGQAVVVTPEGELAEAAAEGAETPVILATPMTFAMLAAAALPITGLVTGEAPADEATAAAATAPALPATAMPAIAAAASPVLPGTPVDPALEAVQLTPAAAAGEVPAASTDEAPTPALPAAAQTPASVPGQTGEKAVTAQVSEDVAAAAVRTGDAAPEAAPDTDFDGAPAGAQSAVTATNGGNAGGGNTAGNPNSQGAPVATATSAQRADAPVLPGSDFADALVIAATEGATADADGAPAQVPSVSTAPAAAAPQPAVSPAALVTPGAEARVDAPAPITGDPVRAFTAPAAPAVQLAPHIAALKQGPDGVHRMTVVLTPDELGPVQIRVEVRDGTMSLQMAGSSELAREALRVAMPDLRRELTNSGISTGSFDVRGDLTRGGPDGSASGRSDRDGSSGQAGQSNSQSGTARGNDAPAADPRATAATQSTSGGARALDLSL